MSEPQRARRVTAIVAAAQLGGTERVLLEFAIHAFEHGIALRVLSPRHGPLIDLLNNLGVPAAAVPAPTALLRASQRPGHLASVLPAMFGLRQWSRDLARHDWLQDVEVVYTVAFKAHLAAAMTRIRPVVWHLHEFPPARTGGMWRFLSRKLPDALIANSYAVGEAWRQRKKPREPRTRDSGEWRVGSAESRRFRKRSHAPRIAVVPNGVDLDRFRPADRTHWIHNELGIGWETRLVGMPAVFARWKGQFEVIEAFEAIADDLPDVHLVLVGGSIYDTVSERRYGADLTERIQRSPAAARVHLLPFQQRIERVYPELDIVVHYSTRAEPFGRVVLEAMACGVPVMAAAEGGPLEILGGGIGPQREAGWLAEPRAPEQLAARLRSALELPRERLRSIGEAGRRRAEDAFSARAFAENVARVLLGVGERQGTGSREQGLGVREQGMP